ncbi:MAG: hypothetical protein HY558_07720 [Euryarchaeota archaeon]|nr:hypothetical protein [Euryarchaeota archaeon]
MSGPLTLGLDLEGPIFNPACDFGWTIARRYLQGADGRRDLEALQGFDRWDDLLYLRQRRTRGHSTGATPLVSALLAHTRGATTRDLHRLARRTLAKNPGAPQLLRWLHRESPLEVLYITSGHPLVGLSLARETHPGPARVYTSGYTLRHARGSVESQAEARWPSRLFTAHRRPLRGFLDGLLEACGREAKALETDNRRGPLREQYPSLFRGVEPPPLRAALTRLLRDEEGIMGGHRKAWALSRHAPPGRALALGDSIVDIEMLRYTPRSITMNCTHPRALLSARLNLCVDRMDTLIPLLDDASRGLWEPHRWKRELQGASLRLHTPRDIRAHPRRVLEENRRFKENLKSLLR